MKAPEPGVHRDVAAEDYHAWDAASASQLEHLLRSPAHLAAYRANPPASTPAQVLGTAIHTAVLEADEFDDRYVTGKQCEAETSKGGRCSRAGTWPVAGGGFRCTQHLTDGSPVDTSRTVLSPEDRQMCRDVADSVHRHSVAGPLIRAATHTEVCIVWDDPVTGVRCKARLDAYAPLDGGAIPDLKTALDGDYLSFERSILRWGYHRKAWFYLRGAAEVGLPAKHFPLVVVEKSAPYAVDVYRVSDSVVTYIEDQMTALLTLYGECSASGQWPGRPERVREIAIPDWGWRKIDEETAEVEGLLQHVRHGFTKKENAA